MFILLPYFSLMSIEGERDGEDMSNLTDEDRIEIRNLILEIVEDKQGCKGAELAVAFVRKQLQLGKEWGTEDFIEVLDRVVVDRGVIEIEYKLPKMGDRMKTFLLPKQSSIWINNVYID